MTTPDRQTSTLTLGIFRVSAYVLLLLALVFLVWSAVAKIDVSAPAVTLVIVGFSALLIAELLPRIQTLKLSTTGVDIGLQGLSESITGQILELSNRVAKLELERPSASSVQQLQATKSGWKPAPKELTKPGEFEDDTRKGKFGGKRESKGLRLDAEFPRSTREWAEIKLIVRDVRDDQNEPAVTAVEFFLDDTFDVPRVKVPMIDGEAQLSITSWGGFTVGVWAPERDATLELDLSKLRNAPRVVREQ